MGTFLILKPASFNVNYIGSSSGGGGSSTTSYSVIYTLSGYSSSNTASSVTAGGSYSTTITLLSGYTAGTISVKMGGVAQTVSSSGSVIISNVTGNIVITAVAQGGSVVADNLASVIVGLYKSTGTLNTGGGWRTTNQISVTEGTTYKIGGFDGKVRLCEWGTSFSREVITISTAGTSWTPSENMKLAINIQIADPLPDGETRTNEDSTLAKYPLSDAEALFVKQS